MSAYDPRFVPPSRGILRWLRRQSDPAEMQEPAPSADDDTRGLHWQGAMLGEIGDFLSAHRLDVTPYTLTIACDVISGADSRLARRIEKRMLAGQAVTLEWLESARANGAATLETLMDRLAASIEEFSETTIAARTATTDYNSALEEHVDELEQVSKAGVVITELATVARAMLDRTREIERQMAQSEMQTRALQDRLEKARREAEQDHLTGLPNRRAFEAAFDAEYQLATANREPLSVAFCDIDNFKRINDRHGHEAGDRVLKAVAQSLAAISNDRCHVARHGGEEFVVLLRGKTAQQAFELLDAARIAMSERRLVNRATEEPFGQVTFSGGIADVFAYPARGEALKAADAALYAAKQAGRNRIEIAGD